MPNAEKYARYDAAEFLRSPAEIQQFLEIVFEENQDDPAAIAAAIGAATRAHGMIRTAKETGLTREGLYKAFSESGNPSFANVLKVMKALGLGVKPISLPRRKTAKPRPRARRKAA
ncbi:MAG: addiction module antidote protein [Parvibaculaceae bacterium]